MKTHTGFPGFPRSPLNPCGPGGPCLLLITKREGSWLLHSTCYSD